MQQDFEFPQVNEIESEIYIHYKYKGEERMSMLNSIDEIFNETVSSILPVGLVSIDGKVYYGKSPKIIQDHEGEYCVELLSVRRKNCSIEIPVSDLLGYFDVIAML